MSFFLVWRRDLLISGKFSLVEKEKQKTYPKEEIEDEDGILDAHFPAAQSRHPCVVSKEFLCGLSRFGSVRINPPCQLSQGRGRAQTMLQFTCPIREETPTDDEKD